MIESKLKANNCNRRQLFRPGWVSSVRCSKLWSIQLVDWYPYTHYKMVMTSDETDSNPNSCQLANVTCKTRDKGQQENPEYHVVAAIRKLRTDTNCPAGKSWKDDVKKKKWAAYRIWKDLRPQKILDSKTWWCKGPQTKMLPMNAWSVKDLISQNGLALLSHLNLTYGEARSFFSWQENLMVPARFL